MYAAAIAQWWTTGLVIERLLTPGSILELAMRRCVIGKNIYAYFPLGSSSLPVVVTQPDERLANRIQKKCSALVWLDRRRVPGLFERTNDPANSCHV